MDLSLRFGKDLLDSVPGVVRGINLERIVFPLQLYSFWDQSTSVMVPKQTEMVVCPDLLFPKVAFPLVKSTLLSLSNTTKKSIRFTMYDSFALEGIYAA